MSSLSSDSVTRVVVFRSLVPGVFCAGESSVCTYVCLRAMVCVMMFSEVNQCQVCVRVFITGADLKERAGMNHAESDLFVHGLRSLMTQIGQTHATYIRKNFTYMLQCY